MATTEVINLAGVELKLSAISQKVDSVDAHVGRMESQMKDVKAEMAALRKDFLQMMEEQRRATALEQASTELVTVRQEMEKKFGNYAVVRNTMVGILQATDSALVRKATVSTVSEELMISTPDYWLAPVLVALAAWINNNRDLADRAIREAVRRDNEHTSLAMALVCRRNGRVAACHEWLARYFSTQDAANIDADSMVYIDAYINGIFGSDEKHLCEDYMARWIKEIQDQTPGFEEKQSKIWADYFKSYNANLGTKFPALKAIAQEYGYIEKYFSKVNSIDAISQTFKGIFDCEVDAKSLAKEVDSRLMDLVNSDDPGERQLRAQEEYLLAVKAYGGDIQKARLSVNLRSEAKRRQTMNIVDQMTGAMRDTSGKTEAYKKKTAMRFLGPYINKGFDQYRDSDVPTFPEKVTLGLDGWSGLAVTGDEGPALKADYASYLDQKKAEELAELGRKVESSSKSKLYAAIICIAIAVAVAISAPSLMVVSVALTALSAVMLYGRSHDTTYETQSKELDEKYATQSKQGCGEIDLALGQWKAAKQEAEKRADLLKTQKVA